MISLENAKFLILTPHYNCCIVQWSLQPIVHEKSTCHVQDNICCKFPQYIPMHGWMPWFSLVCKLKQGHMSLWGKATLFLAFPPPICPNTQMDVSLPDLVSCRLPDYFFLAWITLSITKFPLSYEYLNLNFTNDLIEKL